MYIYFLLELNPCKIVQPNMKKNIVSGLFGNNGILPARLQIENNNLNIVTAIHKRPTLLHLAAYIGLDTEYMMDVLALLGIVISFTGYELK